MKPKRYRMKAGKPGFREVDGSHKGMSYNKGGVYKADEIPPGKRDWFEPVKDEEKSDPEPKPKKKKNDKGGDDA